MMKPSLPPSTRCRSLRPLVLGFLVLAGPGIFDSRADETPLLSGKEIPLHGVLTTHDAASKSLDVEIKRGNKTGLVEKFVYDEQTVWLNQRKMEVENIKAGDRVVVQGERSGDFFDARTISISPLLDESSGNSSRDKLLRGTVKEAGPGGILIDEEGVVVTVNTGALKGVLAREKLDERPDFKSRQALRLFHRGGRLVVVVVPE